MQYSPNIKNSKNITIKEVSELLLEIKNKSLSNLPNNINLSESQKRFLWCVANIY